MTNFSVSLWFIHASRRAFVVSETGHRTLPQAGEVLLWPAFLHHLVHPNLALETRVSFNVMLKWQGSYLP